MIYVEGWDGLILLPVSSDSRSVGVISPAQWNSKADFNSDLEFCSRLINVEPHLITTRQICSHQDAHLQLITLIPHSTPRP
jgi:hypothetical protein